MGTDDKELEYKELKGKPIELTGRAFTILFDTVERHEKLIGHPPDEYTKPLFEMVDALNKQVLELRLKIEGMEAKEKNYDYEVG